MCVYVCVCACIKAQVMCCQELIKKSIRSWAGVLAIGQAFASILTLVTDTFLHIQRQIDSGGQKHAQMVIFVDLYNVELRMA